MLHKKLSNGLVAGVLPRETGAQIIASDQEERET